MTAPLNVGPCEPWPYICDDFPAKPTSEEQIIIDSAVMAATEALWHRTKRQFGLCELTLRPCRRECWSGSTWALWGPLWQNATGWSWPFPALVGGQWINVACGACGDHCSCSTVKEIVLPYPVANIVKVVIDGVVLPSSAYRVDNHRLLVRVDGGDWPRCNDLSREDTEEGTWSVTAQYGHAVPHLAQLAVGQLASAIFKACTGAANCPLPAATVRQITRQGVTKVFFDAESAFAKGKIGLYYPDLFIHTYNPSATGITSIYNIDGPRRRTTTIAPGT